MAGGVSMRATQSRDSEIGRWVRVQRLSRGLSQRELGTHIGVSLHQVQKYEQGRNHIGSGRLERIAEVLGVPVAFFFMSEGIEQPTAADDLASPLDYLKSEGAVRLVRAYSRISDSKARYAIVQIVEHIAHERAPRRRRSAKKQS
jgi:transcriptional regulator with XRE-family HTH domain